MEIGLEGKRRFNMDGNVLVKSCVMVCRGGFSSAVVSGVFFAKKLVRRLF